MLERTLEIALSRYPQLLADDLSLVGQQLATGAGILDLPFKDRDGSLHLVEVKKSGFKEYRRQISITAGSELSLNASLQPN